MSGPHEVGHRLRRTRLQVALKASDVRAGTEGTARTRYDHGAHGGIQLDVVEGAHNSRQQFAIEGIKLVRSIERQQRNAFFDTKIQKIGHVPALSVRGGTAC